MESQIPLQRLCSPQNVADCVSWLLSDLASMVTGSDIAVDGGRSMGGHGL
jgi:enoyl-[acyl-carrier-protein] reductase (NADH)